MRVVMSGSAFAFKVAVLAATMMSSAAWGEVHLKDVSIHGPGTDSFIVISPTDRISAGMPVHELKDLPMRVSNLEKELERLRAENDTLTRNVEQQARQIRELESKQDRSVSDQKSGLDKLSRELEDLRRRVN